MAVDIPKYGLGGVDEDSKRDFAICHLTNEERSDLYAYRLDPRGLEIIRETI
jgi:hypothetical protein